MIGATIFPHNIGLGAAHNPKLMREIGRITAKEMRVTGTDWTFATTLAVAQKSIFENICKKQAITTNHIKINKHYYFKTIYFLEVPNPRS